MGGAKKSRETREENHAVRELFGIRARLVGDELINEHGQVIAVINRRALHAWLLSHPTVSTFSTVSLSLPARRASVL